MFGSKFDWHSFGVVKPYLTSGPGAPTFMEVNWCDVEPTPGKRNWSSVDQTVANAISINATMVVKIRVETCWATGVVKPVYPRGSKTESYFPLDTTQYQAFVVALVQRYSPQGVHDYAIENESNLKMQWNDTPARYEALAQIASSAIRAADPVARIVDTGVSSLAYGVGIAQRLLNQGRISQAISAYNTYYGPRFSLVGDLYHPATDEAGLRALMATPTGQDSLTWLALTEKLAQNHVVDVRQIHYYSGYRAAPLLASYLRATTPQSVAVEAWEVGDFPFDATRSAAELSDNVIKTTALLVAGQVKRVMWLPLMVTTGSGDGLRYPLLNSDGSPRIAAVAYRTMANAAVAATVVPVRTATFDGVSFESQGYARVFLWSRTGNVAISPPAGVTVADPATGAAGSRTTLGTSPREFVGQMTTSDLVASL